MKTLLSIGVLVAVIAWAAGQDKIECWRGKFFLEDFPTYCVFNPPETTLNKTACVKGECPKNDLRPNAKVACWKRILSFGMKVVQTQLGCGIVEPEDDFKCYGESVVLDDKPGGTDTNCFCNTAFCNADPKLKPKPETTPKPENAADGTSYTHSIIAFIVGAMFLH